MNVYPLWESPFGFPFFVRYSIKNAMYISNDHATESPKSKDALIHVPSNHPPVFSIKILYLPRFCLTKAHGYVIIKLYFAVIPLIFAGMVIRMNKRRICIFMLCICLFLTGLCSASVSAASVTKIESWQIILVNPWNALPKDYSVTLKTVSGSYKVDERCYADLTQMMKDCKAAGYSPLIISAYRTQAQQESLYNRKVNSLRNEGYSLAEAKKKAATSVAIPGTSEHQLGLALDIVDANYQSLTASQAKRPTQKWLMNNCWKYGFTLRYPEDKTAITGIIYEPWHYRYVGHAVAKIMHETGLTLEEYLEALTKTPTVTAFNAASTGKIQLKWYPLPEAKEYEIFRADAENGPYVKLRSHSTVQYQNSSVTTGQTYFYQVRAVYADGSTSAFSTPVSIACAPAQPQVTISNTADGRIRLTWADVEGAAQYEIYRADSQSGPYTKITSTSGTSCTNVDPQSGGTYFYKVRAVCADGVTASAFSAPVSGNSQLAAPYVTAENIPATGKIKLTWKAVNGAAKYEIYRATNPDGPYSKMSPTTGTAYTSVSITPGITYYYRVRAVAKDGTVSAYHTVSKTCCPAQPKVTLTNTAAGRIQLKWEAVSGATGYEIYRADAPDGTYAKLRTHTSTVYQNTSIEFSKTYYYKVNAVCDNAAAKSAFSAPVSGKRILETPKVRISLTDAGKPRLDWNAVDGAVQYEIYRATSKSGTYSKMSPTTGTYYQNPSASSGKTYYYKVRAISADGTIDSPFCAPVSIRTK